MKDADHAFSVVCTDCDRIAIRDLMKDIYFCPCCMRSVTAEALTKTLHFEKALN